jgi:hypothetical protein
MPGTVGRSNTARRTLGGWLRPLPPLCAALRCNSSCHAVLRLLCCACCAALCCLQVGMVRDLQFVTPVKARIGPPQAACHQTQRLQVGAGPLS